MRGAQAPGQGKIRIIGNGFAPVKADGFHLALGRIQGDLSQGVVAVVADPFQESGARVKFIVQGFKKHIAFFHGFGNGSVRKVIGIAEGDDSGSNGVPFRYHPPHFIIG